MGTPKRLCRMSRSDGPVINTSTQQRPDAQSRTKRVAFGDGWRCRRRCSAALIDWRRDRKIAQSDPVQSRRLPDNPCPSVPVLASDRMKSSPPSVLAGWAPYGSSDAPTRVRLPSLTRTDATHGWNPVISRRISCVPSGISAIAIGVRPTTFPSRSTCAPWGWDRTSITPP